MRQLVATDELSERDLSVLMAVAELRLVTGGQLQRLVFGNPAARSHNARLARRCLQRLAFGGWLWRLNRRVGGVRAGSSSYIYTLAPKGGMAIRRPAGRGRQREPSLSFAQHGLAISEQYVRLHEAAFAGRLETVDIETEPRCWRSLDDGHDAPLRPDLFVRALTADEEVRAFVEIDGGTEHVTAVHRKLALYDSYFASGIEQVAYGVFPLVVWLAPDGRRVSQLRGYLASARRTTPGLHHVAQADGLIQLITKGGDHE